MNSILDAFKKNKNLNENNQQNVGNFDFSYNQSLNSLNPNEINAYQQNLIDNKNNLIRPRQRDNAYYNPQIFNNNLGYQMNNFNQPRQINPNQAMYNNNNYNLNENLNYNYQNPNALKQDYFNFDNNAYNVNNYSNQIPQHQQVNQIYNSPNLNQINHVPHHINHISSPINRISNHQVVEPIYQNYQVPNDYMQHGYNDFSNNNQFYNMNNPYAYNPNVNYALSSSNSYNNKYSYVQRMKMANIIPKEIAKEIRSEKLRTFLMFLIGAVGILVTSFMLAIYYKAGPEGEFLKIKRNQVMYPFFSIILLIVSIGFFGVSITDYGFLFSNVKKYERELMMGGESVPYFITRNYRSLISRGIYLNWIAFCIYIFGAISLGLMYGLQYQYENKNAEIYFLFWKIGKLKSLNSEIKTNIVVLFVTLFIHVLNIITSRTRKNNIISYYGSEIIPQQEIIEIKRKTNKVCMIIFFTFMALILFLIVVPWLIIRKKRGLPIRPWGKVNA